MGFLVNLHGSKAVDSKTLKPLVQIKPEIPKPLKL